MLARYLIILLVFTAMTFAQTPKVLVFSRTTGYRHDSIPTAIEALRSAGLAQNVIFEDTEEPSKFTDDQLALYDALLFLMVTDISPNDILNTDQQTAFQNYLNKGGNFIGIHSASDCLHDADFYRKELGAYFLNHPPISEATFINDIEPTHPTVAMIPARWTYTEEVYNFKSDPRHGKWLHPLEAWLTASSTGGDANASIQGSPHPTAWYQDRGAGVSDGAAAVGRSFYTSLGHLNSTWQDATFMGHVMAGVTWTLQAGTTKAYNSAGLVGNPSAQASLPSTSAAQTSDGSENAGAQVAVVAAAVALAPLALFGLP